MSFSLSGSTITQSGTDTSLSGLSGVSGVSVQTSGTIKSYSVGDVALNITGTLSIDPDAERLVSIHGNGGLVVANGGVLNFGKVTTVNGYSYRSQGVGYVNSDTPDLWYGAFYGNDMAFRVDSGGKLNWNGGQMSCPNNGFVLADGSTVAIQEGVFLSGMGNADAGRQIICFFYAAATGAGLKVTGGEIYFGGSYVNGSFSGLVRQASSIAHDASSVSAQTFRDVDAGGRGNVIDIAVHSSVSGGNNSSNTTPSQVTVLGSASGTNLTMIGAEVTSPNDYRNYGYIVIKKLVSVKTASLTGASISGANFWLRDKNNGVRKNLNSINDTADKTYLWTSDSNGMAASQAIATGIVNVPNPQPRGTANSGVYSVDLRGKTNNLGDDLFDINAVGYAYLLQAQTFALKGAGTLQAVFTLLADSSVANITETQAGALSSIATLDQLYAAAKYWKTRPALTQLEYPTSTSLPVTASGTVLNLGALNLVVDANASAAFALNTATGTVTIKSTALAAGSLFTTLSTTGTVSVSNGATLGLIYSDSTGRHVQVTAAGLAAGTRVQLWNVTDAVEVDNSIVSGPGGYVLPLTYAADKIYRLRATYQSGATAMMPVQAAGTFGSLGLAFSVTQTADVVYNAAGIDGSTASEFSADFTNVQVDVSSSGGTTSVQRLYAWLVFEQTQAPGIRNFYGSISATDSVNFVIDQTIVNLQLDNINSSPVRVIGGYLSRKDGSTVIAPASGSIQMDPSRAYVAGLSNPIVLSPGERLVTTQAGKFLARS